MTVQGRSLKYVRAVAPAALAAALCAAAPAATLCVNQDGTGGCYTTIGGAIQDAGTNDMIEVAAGTYNEGVVIGKSLALIATNPRRTVIDASGQPNGVMVDGINNPGLAHVIVSGFTIRNANYEGILVTSASAVTISGNHVLNNNKSQVLGAMPTCPGIPAFETNEGADCGEGIHLMGADHSSVVNNTVENNSGGILISDETGPNHDNLIGQNLVRNNPYDCGITLASHVPAKISSSTTPFGVYHNTVTGNQSYYNGVAGGGGAGIGIFAPSPGTANYGNVVTNNTVLGNGHPGISLHNHAPGGKLDDNMLIGNHVLANGADTGDAATKGTTGIHVYAVTPVNGVIISENLVEQVAIAVDIKTPTASSGAAFPIQVHLNNFPSSNIGLNNEGASGVDATQNWWGCSGADDAAGCASISGTGVLSIPALPRKF